MKIVIVLVGLIWTLAGPATCSGQKPIDLGAFDKWLVESLPNDSEPERNVAFIRSNLGQVKDSKARRAGEILLEIAESTECNGRILGNLKQLAGQKELLSARKRTLKVMEGSLDETNANCARYIEKQAASLYRTSLANKLEAFVEVVRPFSWGRAPFSEFIKEKAPLPVYFAYTTNSSDHSLNPRSGDWINILAKLAIEGEMSQVGAGEKVLPQFAGFTRHSQIFDHIVQKYLRQPCQAITTVLGDTFDALFVLADLQCPEKASYEHFAAQRSHLLNHLLFDYKVCQAFQALSWFKLNGPIYQGVKPKIKKAFH